MPDYGREIGKTIGDAVLTCLLDYTQEQIEGIVHGLIQIGIDTYEQVLLGRTYNEDGGIFQGRKLAMLFAGCMLDDATIKSYCDGTTYPVFQEDQQIQYITQAIIDHTQTGVQPGGDWNPDTRNVNYSPYVAGDLGNAEWAVRFTAHLTDYPSGPWGNWGPDSDWDAQYRGANIGNITSSALATRMLGETATWNWPAFFEYADRFVNADPSEHSLWVTGTNGPTSLCLEMWNEYRSNY
jgi:hypothetical protein